MSEITTDAFLGGRVSVAQPTRGYRAGADPVYLAAAVPARSGDSVLELGCGAGVAMLCLLARVPGVQVTGIERDGAAADLARQNLVANDFEGEVFNSDFADLPPEIRSRNFGHVMANPPFFDRTEGTPATSDAREAGRGLETDLGVWIETAVRRLSPGGTLTLINRIERLPDCLAALDRRVGDVSLKPLASRSERPAKLFILNAKKGGRGPFRLASPLILHTGDRHLSDGDSYTPEASAILRDGAPLTLDC